ncbi:MAG: KH domain-containing protein, partial [Clostridia bacterium]|nr:KH domain-containing protein [Clostridia bacterium]
TASESEQTAYRFICKLVEDMELADVTIAMHPGNNDDMVITVDGEAAGVLIGHHGDTLDALQYLANLAANRKEEGEKREYARITVDVESYRAKREDALRILARKKAHQVLKYKKSIMLEPMNPYERRIIHSEIQKMEGVSTNSIGVENNRRIVIFLEEEGMPTAGIKAKGGSEKSSSKSHGKKRSRSGGKTVDPLSTEALTGETRKQGASIFGEEEHDPFDIDLSAATYSEEEDETYEAPEETSDVDTGSDEE